MYHQQLGDNCYLFKLGGDKYTKYSSYYTIISNTLSIIDNIIANTYFGSTKYLVKLAGCSLWLVYDISN